MFFLFFRATILATGAFLDAFQKVADIATNTKGQLRFHSQRLPVFVSLCGNIWETCLNLNQYSNILYGYIYDEVHFSCYIFSCSMYNTI